MAERQIIHVDMDAFFASVEQRDHPELCGLPVLVGGSAQRGVVAAASYEARKFGIHSAMPMAQALKRCPHARVVSGRHGRYGEVSAEIFAIFREFTPLVEGLSVDEAFLDVTGCQRLLGPAPVIAVNIRRKIREQVRLTASAGVAPNKFLAKLASDVNKPDGLTVVHASEIRAFLDPLPVERIWGLGKVGVKPLHAKGITHIGQLARWSEEELCSVLGNLGRHVYRCVQGIDEREVVVRRGAKSMGSEETFEHDVTSKEVLRRSLLGHAQRVGLRLLKSQATGRTVTVKLKTNDFKLRTVQRSLSHAVQDTDEIYRVACELLDEVWPLPRPIRLAGLSVGGFCSTNQLSMFESQPSRHASLDALALKMRERFGEDKLTRATLLEKS